MKEINLSDIAPNKKHYKKLVFLIEDDQQLKRIYLREFTSRGVEVEYYETGFDALSEVKKKRPDVVLSDILTPGLGGIEFIKSIKADKDIKDIPVITYSALSKKVIAKKALEAGAVKHLGKSDYTPQEVVKIVLKYIK